MAHGKDADIAGQLLAETFQRSGPAADALTDPIADTPMVVTLDQLRPYDLNPRVTVNPLYAEIKASIRERGLDAAPAITRRPGEAHYTIRNGGNTRLAILRELWAETKDERFFRIPCLFRPWPARGEIVALTGHLAENELHGSLTFIERALGVEKARELYEQENGGKPMTQAELARRLAADGYPVPQPHISRMRDAVQYLLPAIPSLLYAGLGRHQVERLSLLRKAGEHAWAQRAIAQAPTMEFADLFQEVLSGFDALPDGFSYERVQDELIGQMAQWLEADYDTLALDIAGVESRQRALLSVPAPLPGPDGGPGPAPHAVATTRPETRGETPPAAPRAPSAPTPRASSAPDAERAAPASSPITPDPLSTRVQEHVVSPAASTERLQSLQKLVADHHGEASPSFADNVVQAIPVQAGGLYPISDVWHIDPGLDTPDRLRVHIAQFAREIAAEGSAADRIAATGHGLGFACDEDPAAVAPLAHAMLALLRALEAGYAGPAALAAPCTLAETLTPLLRPHGTAPRLSDSGLVKLFRLLRLARRLAEVEAGADAIPT
ncbi:ParB family protein [Xanthomonas nasturtii]|uniref:ParB family protein n=1 Tax=Xanthomonas nasturtii TaxID=1843581 RepID=UPI002B2253E9|nr:ParB family protein [Xanthomonas nasturtii]MEA9578742.1 ParB family protein [Xanthomonas nasturtii]